MIHDRIPEGGAAVRSLWGTRYVRGWLGSVISTWLYSVWDLGKAYYILENLFLMMRKRKNSTPKTAAATANEARNEFNETPALSWALPAEESTAPPTLEREVGVADALIVNVRQLRGSVSLSSTPGLEAVPGRCGGFQRCRRSELCSLGGRKGKISETEPYNTIR
jgi:hypothetical protein